MSNGSDQQNEEEKKDGLYRSVELREERRERWLREGERPLWANLSMIGSLGWLIVVPTVLGAFIGRWLDELTGQTVFWTGSLIFIGAALGLYLVWQRMDHS